MATPPPDISDEHPKHSSCGGRLDGYIAVLILGVYFLYPHLLNAIPFLVGISINIALLGLGIRFSLWGIKSSHGAGKIVLYVVLAVLCGQALLTIMIALNGVY